jgi:hypothetical protein
MTRPALLLKLFTAYRANVDELTVSIYRDGLVNVSDAALAAGVDKAIQQNAFLPSVATLIAACREAMPVVDAVKQLPGVVAHDGQLFICAQCKDTAWLREDVEHPAGYTVEAVKRCPCWQTNPRYRASLGGHAA